MKSAGLISFFSRENYGAILQSVALQKALENFGIKGVYINYAPSTPLSMTKRLVNIVYSYVRLILGYRKRKKRTDLFRKKHLCCTSKIDDYNHVKDYLDKFDFFIVGSDQVWNPKWLDVSKNFYLLSFIGGVKKYSYASSFGVSDISAENKSIYKQFLDDFSLISVRENTGRKILESINLKPKVVLDPTLLLSANEWLSFFQNKPLVSGKYIFCYVMTGDHKSAKCIYKYAKELKSEIGESCKIIIVGDKEYKRFIPDYNLICDAGPSEFLNLLYFASYVVTNSYHGTCFSVNFSKKFTVILRKENYFNSRIVDLLDILSLSSNIIYTDSNLEVKNNLLIDSYTESELIKLRMYSMNFIKSIVSENEYF